MKTEIRYITTHSLSVLSFCSLNNTQRGSHTWTPLGIVGEKIYSRFPSLPLKGITSSNVISDNITTNTTTATSTTLAPLAKITQRFIANFLTDPTNNINRWTNQQKLTPLNAHSLPEEKDNNSKLAEFSWQ